MKIVKELSLKETILDLLSVGFGNEERANSRSWWDPMKSSVFIHDRMERYPGTLKVKVEL